MTPLLRFADAAYLLLLAVVPALAYWYVTRGRRQIGSLRFSSLAAITRADHRRGGRLRHVLFGLRALALLALVVAFARPQTGVTAENVTTEGIDIVLTLDLSSSMLAEDLEPNRIDAARQVAADFVRGRRKRPHRVGGVRRQRVHAGATDPGLRCGDDDARRARGRRHRGRHRHRHGAGHGGQTAAGIGRRVESHRAADRRAQQPRRDRPDHRGADGAGARHPHLRGRRRHTGGGAGAGR